MGGIIVDDQMDLQGGGYVAVQVVEKGHKLLMAMARFEQ